MNLGWESRTHIKTTLYNYLLEKEISAPPFIRNKLTKLLVDIARYDWPHIYPDFFINILHVILHLCSMHKIPILFYEFLVVTTRRKTIIRFNFIKNN